jgi:DDE superfamily endonuclease
MDTASVARSEQLNNLRAFRQAVYDHALTGRRDAQFELLDALLLRGPTHSFAALSQSPVFRRTWASAYAALEDGRQDEVWLRQCLVQQLPQQGSVFLGIDSTAWPRPRAPTLPDRQFCHSPTPAVLSESVVIGQPYSLVAWIAEAGSAWALPLEVTRIPSSASARTLAAEQIARLNKLRAPDDTALWIYALDGNYGNHHFWQALPATDRYGVVTRLRHDRVLYRAPPPYAGRGRPRKHGPRFAFRDLTTWGPPAEAQTVQDAEWGQVDLRVWADLHDRQEAARPFRVVRIVVHQERAQPSAALWLSWHGPARTGEEIWRAYGARWSIEPSIRVRKEQLHWTQPAVGSLGAMQVWTVLVSVAMWVLWFARGLVADCPLPWQRAQAAATPGRVQAGLGALFAGLGTPAAAPQPRGKAPGWPAGRVRRRQERSRVVKKAPRGARSPPRRRRK